jgi:hypothetical protein
MQKGSKHSKKTREKMRVSALTRNDVNRILALPRGEGHPMWTKEPNKLTLHKRIWRKYGAAKKRKCLKCSKQAMDWANITGKYTDLIEDYAPLCRSCHVKLDKNWIKKSSA